MPIHTIPMTLCQTITIDYNEEMKNTRKLLELVPFDEARRGYRPHPKSMPMDRLATHTTEMPGWIKFCLDTEEMNMQPGFQPRVAKSSEELLKMFDESVAAGRAAIDTAKDEALGKFWTFKFAGNVVFSTRRDELIRSLINHVAHHRAQLGVYLRMNDIKLPGVYGPSADEPIPGM